MAVEQQIRLAVFSQPPVFALKLTLGMELKAANIQIFSFRSFSQCVSLFNILARPMTLTFPWPAALYTGLSAPITNH
jgi:hypothetical protein